MLFALKDKVMGLLDNGIKTVFTPVVAQRVSPADTILENEMSEQEKRESVRLMRVNHCGEVCAQALYQGQALFSREPEIANSLQESATEEVDHLAWTAKRIHDLGGRQSFLTPLWYGGSLLIGAAMASVSDRFSLGFVAETERQVSKHLDDSLNSLPEQDLKSRAIVSQMNIDEQQHAAHALSLGGEELPPVVKEGMQLLGRVMTKSSYWI